MKYGFYFKIYCARIIDFAGTNVAPVFDFFSFVSYIPFKLCDLAQFIWEYVHIDPGDIDFPGWLQWLRSVVCDLYK